MMSYQINISFSLKIKKYIYISMNFFQMCFENFFLQKILIMCIYINLFNFNSKFNHIYIFIYSIYNTNVSL